MNPEGLPQLSGACLYSNPPLLLSLRVFLTPPSLRTPPLYFAVQNTGEEGESNLPLIAVQYSAYGARQGEDCDTNDFLSQSKKVLVTLIRFICSFFSTARRTNQEAPPLLSGFWVRRHGRRRGLRNSLRSDSPRPFSSVFLATSPPDKGGDFAHAFAGLFNPSVTVCYLLYMVSPHPVMLRDTAGEEFCDTLLLCDFAGKIRSILTFSSVLR